MLGESVWDSELVVVAFGVPLCQDPMGRCQNTISGVRT